MLNVKIWKQCFEENLQNDNNEGHQRLDDTELEGALLAEPGDMVTLDL